MFAELRKLLGHIFEGDFMRIQLASLACCTILLAGLNPARADTITDYGFPPPGGATSSKISGSSPADAGGIVRSYSGFNSAAYGDLYFGLNGIDMGRSGSLSNLTTVGPFETNTETWTGTVAVTDIFGVTHRATGTFTATLNTGVWIDASSVGIGGTSLSGNPAPLAVTDVLGNFQVTEAFTVGGMSFNAWYNQWDNGGAGNQSDVSGDFWATSPSAVPGPVLGGGAPGLILACGGLLGWLLRKRRDIAAV
jgi:hypothetical protein